MTTADIPILTPPTATTQRAQPATARHRATPHPLRAAQAAVRAYRRETAYRRSQRALDNATEETR